MATPFEELATWHSTSSSGMQSRFSNALALMLREGLIWRDEGADLETYNLLVRHLAHAKEYFSMAGLKLIHHERLHILQLASEQPGLRRSLSKETTLWALICRLIYSEIKESGSLTLSRYPSVLSGDLYMRYAELFPARNLRKKTAFAEALAELSASKMIRSSALTTSCGIMTDPDAVIELLPTLEVLIPVTRLKEISDRLGEFGACLN
jgi:hypothetical protein